MKENLENRQNLPISESKRQQYIASCLFIRDISWYYLAQVYSQPYAYNPDSKAIPIHTEAVTGPGKNEAELWTIGQIYNQIIEDLSSSQATNLLIQFIFSISSLANSTFFSAKKSFPAIPKSPLVG